MFLAGIPPLYFVCDLKRFDTRTVKDTFDAIRKELLLFQARVKKGGYSPAVKALDKIVNKSPRNGMNTLVTDDLYRDNGTGNDGG